MSILWKLEVRGNRKFALLTSFYSLVTTYQARGNHKLLLTQ